MNALALYVNLCTQAKQVAPGTRSSAGLSPRVVAVFGVVIVRRVLRRGRRSVHRAGESRSTTVVDQPGLPKRRPFSRPILPASRCAQVPTYAISCKAAFCVLLDMPLIARWAMATLCPRLYAFCTVIGSGKTELVKVSYTERLG